MAEKSIADQLIEFIREHESRINKEKFTTLEFVVQNGVLDGMRTKEYVKRQRR